MKLKIDLFISCSNICSAPKLILAFLLFIPVAFNKIEKHFSYNLRRRCAIYKKNNLLKNRIVICLSNGK